MLIIRCGPPELHCLGFHASMRNATAHILNNWNSKICVRACKEISKNVKYFALFLEQFITKLRFALIVMYLIGSLHLGQLLLLGGCAPGTKFVKIAKSLKIGYNIACINLLISFCADISCHLDEKANELTIKIKKGKKEAASEETNSEDSSSK